MADNLGHKAIKGTIWVTLDKFGVLGCQFIVNIIMARKLMPSDYGAVSMLAIFTVVANTLIDGGFGNALIQKKKPTQTDYSTVFFWNLGLSLVLYAALYFSAPAIARFFNLPILVGVTRLIGLTLIINALIMVQTTRLRKHLAFKTLAIVDITAAVGGGIGGIIMASNGLGVYSLVLQTILMGMIQIAMLLMLERWLPAICFSMATMKSLFSFGGYLLAANLLQATCKNFQNIIIGKKFSDVQLGLYSQAQKMNDIAGYTIPQILVQVMYPVYSSIQDDSRRLIEMLKMNIRVISFVIYPVMMLLILIAEPIFTLLYGMKWIDAVPYFQLLCCGGFFTCLQNISFYAVAAKGYSSVLFKISIYKWGALLAFLFIGMNFGMTGLLIGIIASEFNIFIVNAVLAQKYVGLSTMIQFRVLAPIVAVTAASAVISYLPVTLAGLNGWFMLPIFIASYFGLSVIFRLQAIGEARSVIAKIKHKND